MTINITSRHFTAHEEIHNYAEAAVQELTRYYDGIVKANVILSFQKTRKSTKLAEVNIAVFGATLSGKAESDDFQKSIDKAATKVLVQLKKYKDKLHAKDRTHVRRIREKG